MGIDGYKPEVKIKHPRVEMDVEIKPEEAGRRNFIHLILTRDGTAKISCNNSSIAVPDLESFIAALIAAREAAQMEIGYRG